ncbi:MAG: hypothetical protein JSR17_12655 [Proteobacteria bacterium]|nr:hypothetical protein [Pseudomonadota bacterium]
MHKAPAFLLHLNSPLSFVDDEALAEEIRGQTFTVTHIETLLLNDFYFNHELFPVYELTSAKGNKIRLSPFTFEQDDEELKLRITRDLSDEEVKALFQANTVKQMLNANQDENNYFSIAENEASKILKDWISRTYYLDIKDQEIASSTYIEYDAGNKKNINYAMLLKKYPANKYFLFLGDYNSFYLEVNFENSPKVRATTFLNLSDIKNPEHYFLQKERA